jgi:hypothetical protein
MVSSSLDAVIQFYFSTLTASSSCIIMNLLFIMISAIMFPYNSVNVPLDILCHAMVACLCNSHHKDSVELITVPFPVPVYTVSFPVL